MIEYFSSIPDPHINRRKLHKLEYIFFIALCVAICRTNDWGAGEMCGKAKKSWFDELLGLENDTGAG